MNIKGNLNIIEPWEFGTEESVNITFINKNGDNYLIYLNDAHKINGEDFHYFIVRFKDKIDKDISKLKGTYPLEMGFDEGINSNTFEKFSLDKFRGNFLLGEVIF